MKRTVLAFSVRTVDGRSVDELAAAVGRAVGSAFGDGVFNTIPAKVAVAFGMTIALYPWRGRDDQPIYRMETGLESELFRTEGDDTLDMNVIDVSESVIDVLQAYGAGTWYVPSTADLEAEVDYGYEVDHAFRVTEEDVRRWEAGEF